MADQTPAPSTPLGALVRFEQLLVPTRTVAANHQAFQEYSSRVLPTTLEYRQHVLVDQGFEAGYNAAMDAVRALLVQAKEEVR